MHALATIRQDLAKAGPWKIGAATTLTVSRLVHEHEAEVLVFLGERPVHTFGMVGFITANGLVSHHNREVFWSYYADGGQAPRLFCRELLLEQCWPIEVRETVPGLRLATLDDLDLIVPAHAQSAFDESGVDSLQVDPEGFRQRCARRIELGQTWVWIENGRLIFKAEVLTDTSAVIYVEGVWVDPQDRGKGFGSDCMSQLGRNLLVRSSSVCLLVNEKSEGARACYKKAGYKLVGYYDTIFLKQHVQ